MFFYVLNTCADFLSVLKKILCEKAFSSEGLELSVMLFSFCLNSHVSLFCH